MANNFSSNNFLEYAYDLFQDLPTKEVNLVYVGEVTPAVTRNFTIMTEESLLRQAESSPVQRKVFNVMVEALQNISRHADTPSGDPDDPRKGIIIVSHSGEAYSIVTGNLIRSEKCDNIKAKLDAINVMDKAQLSAAYREQITYGHINENGGAGLGFIDIVKKSGNRIDYRFLDLSEKLPGFCFFLYICTIKRK